MTETEGHDGRPDALVPMVPMDEAPGRFEAIGLRAELAHLNLYRTLLQSEPIAALENEINMRIVRAGVLTERAEALHLRELAIMRVAWVTNDTYVWAHHLSPMVDKDFPGSAPHAGLSVRDGEDGDGFGPAEKAVMRAADEMVHHGELAPDTVRDLRSHLVSDAELVELVYCIALWRCISSVSISLRVPLEDNYQPWPPDGRRPTDADTGRA